LRIASTIVACLLIPVLAHAQEASATYTTEHQRRALDIYRTLISFRTAETHGQVPKMANYLADLFRAGGFAAGDVHVLPLTLESGEQTASLVVRFRGRGASGKKPVLFLAHMDVVDARREDWTRDPFTLVEENGYFFGRGTMDDKSGVTFLATTFLRLKAEGFVPARDLIIAFTGDEETGQRTTEALVTTHRALTDSEFALNADAGGGVLEESGKATSYLLQMSEKTYASFEITVTNPGGHSSLPRVDNAIYQLADVLKRIEAHRFPVQINDATRLYFQNVAQITAGEAGQAMARLAKNPKDAAAADVLWRYPEYVGVTRTTCIATMLRGGHAENALPQSATATVNCRVFPGVEVSEVLATLQGLSKSAAGRVTMLGRPQASAPSPLNEDVMRAVSKGLSRIRPATPVIPYMAPYATDGAVLRRAGIPTYGTIGLFIKASDEFAHGLNERVSVRSFFDGLEYWHAVMTDLAAR
jgi:acetylornithine deacetylase/succinyl-diaminopimelate desuccinylase-like protein